MIDASQVVRAYRNVLLREPEADAVAALVRGAPDAAWVEAELRASVEHRTVVQPLRERLEAEWRHWALRAPTAEELRRGVDAARGRCGSDDAVRQAIADGSIARKLAFRPLKIEMDITNQCNLRCVMCHFSLPSYRAVPRQQISVPQFRSIAEQIFHRAAQVALSFGTEPLLHRELPALLAELQRHEVPHTYLHTNGLLLDERVVAAMVDTGFSVLFVSVDAATAATYEAIRVGGSWAKLRANLDLLARIKARRGGHHPELTLGFVLQRENVAELPAFVELAAEVGATAVNATHMAVWDAVGNGPRGAHHDKAACNAALAEADRRARARHRAGGPAAVRARRRADGARRNARRARPRLRAHRRPRPARLLPVPVVVRRDRARRPRAAVRLVGQAGPAGDGQHLHDAVPHDLARRTLARPPRTTPPRRTRGTLRALPRSRHGRHQRRHLLPPADLTPLPVPPLPPLSLLLSSGSLFWFCSLLVLFLLCGLCVLCV